MNKFQLFKKSLGKITKNELEELVYEATITNTEKIPFNDIVVVDEIHNLVSHDDRQWLTWTIIISFIDDCRKS